MSSNRTEEPTPKKLREARRQGQVPKSKELGSAAVLLATAMVLSATGGPMADALSAAVRAAIAASVDLREGAELAMLEVGAQVFSMAVTPVLVGAMLAGALAAFLQVGPLLALEAVAPDPKRLDPVKGIQNIFAQRQLVELLKAIAKILIIGYVAYDVLVGGLPGLLGLIGRSPTAALHAAGELGLDLLFQVGGAMAAVAVVDVVYQRYRHRRDQHMTKDEVKREHKDAEGDPHAKQQRERLHQEIVDHSTLEDVRRADVLVVNPTHLAVALRYDAEAGAEAPEVVAKGQEHLARRMIDVAREAGVPIMRDVSLAHSLYDLDVGDEIPEVLYEAVAAVLKAAWTERGRGDSEEDASPLNRDPRGEASVDDGPVGYDR